MTPIRKDAGFDSTLGLLAQGYAFISRRCGELHTDVFEPRLMLRRVLCAVGADAAAMFYTPGRFTRRQAMPPTALRLLQDLGSVQLLDDDAHRRRKQMFMALMSPEYRRRLARLFEEHWQRRIGVWTDAGDVVLQHEVEQLLCAAVCQWAGLALPADVVRERAHEFAAMIDGAGAVGPRSWKGWLLRRRTEAWARGIIGDLRAGRLRLHAGSPALALAAYREADGLLLDPDVAAVELLNLLRPTVAMARYVTFAALALHRYPECRQRLQTGDDEYLQWFVQEVRRFYPFFPAVGGRARVAFDWRGTRIAAGTWVVLDLYGTNHDRRIWGDPQVFRPERFSGWDGSAFNFIPQGGGEFDLDHRCAGEWLTIRLLKTAVQLLTQAMDYDVPQQDLCIDLARMPALPRSGFVIRHVRRSPETQQWLSQLRQQAAAACGKPNSASENGA
ncbi:MAG: cytochrome P450 [Burkholderiaceae bacterium]